MVAGVDAPKSDPADVVKSALDGIEAGDFEVLADDVSHQAKAAAGMSSAAGAPSRSRPYAKPPHAV